MNQIASPLHPYLPWIWGAVRVAVILTIGYILTLLISRLLRVLHKRAMSAVVSEGVPMDIEAEKRVNTVISVIRGPVLVLVWGLIALTAMHNVGLHIEPLLAGAGVGAGILGVAIGFGAQTLIKDFLAGMFLLIENQIRLNDVAVINGTGGLVEEINLRTTLLRAENGAVHIFPNGSIQTLSNLTREYAYFLVELTVGYEHDPMRVMAAIQETGAEMQADPAFSPLILAPIEVMGADRLLNSGWVVKGRIKTVAQRQWSVGREFNRRIMAKLKTQGVSLSMPAQIIRQQTDREELKSLVREVLQEMKGTAPDPPRRGPTN